MLKYDHRFKILIIGDSGVGKSSLLFQFADKTFLDSQKPTIGVDLKIKFMEMEGKLVKLDIWDTAGQERFRAITSSYFKGSDGVIVVYDVTNAQTFANVQLWLNDIEQNCNTVNKILVGNKNDDSNRKVVSAEEAQLFADQLGIQLFETSAKNNINVEEIFREITKIILRTKKGRQNSIKIDESGPNGCSNNKCC